jgi:hypothetical protein
MNETPQLRLFIDASSMGQMDACSHCTFQLGISPFLQDASGQTALMAACKSGHTSVACILILFELFRPRDVKTDKDKSLNSSKSIYQNNVLGYHTATELPTITTDMASVIDEGIRKRDNYGMCAFDWAARYGHTSTLSLLRNLSPSTWRTWRQRELFANQMHSKSSNISLHSESEAILQYWESSDATTTLSSNKKLITFRKNTSQNICGYIPKLSVDCCFSSNRWLSAFVPTITFLSLLIGFLLTLYFAYYGQTLRNTVSAIIQMAIIVGIVLIRRKDPGRVVAHAMARSNGLSQSDGNEYLQALWAFYQKAVHRSNHLAPTLLPFEMLVKKINQNAKYIEAEEDDGFAQPCRRPKTEKNNPTNIEDADPRTEPSWQPGVTISTNPYCCHICCISRLHTSISDRSSTVPLHSFGHSKQTFQCLYEFDHYCVFLGIDIAKYNYTLFFTILLCLVGGGFPSFLMSTTEHVQMRIKSNTVNLTTAESGVLMMQSSFKKPIFLQMFIIWSLLIWIQMTALLIFHMYCRLCLGTTSRRVLLTQTHALSQDGKAINVITKCLYHASVRILLWLRYMCRQYIGLDVAKVKKEELKAIHLAGDSQENAF